jgi:NAD(P)-dependent dehydrogenase (short-subunit alcohol dehydrogenase family)
VQNLTGQVAIVVGASSGMGRATAVALAREGVRVMAAARRDTELAALRDEVTAAGGVLDVSQVDASRRADIDRLIAITIEDFGRIDLLVYAAGINLPDRSLERLTPENWERLLATNLSGAFHCTQAVLPVMRRAGGGIIVYLSSGCVQTPDVSGVAYQASKHGLVGLAYGTRVEEQRNGIRTTVIFPGLCDTEILNQRPVPTPRDVLEQALRPEDIAAAVVFVAKLPPRASVPELHLRPSRL